MKELLNNDKTEINSYRFEYLMKTIIKAKNEEEAFGKFNEIEISSENHIFVDVINVTENDW